MSRTRSKSLREKKAASSLGSPLEEAAAPPGRPGLLQEVNVREILRLLRGHSPCSRADLARYSGLSAPTVSSAVARLKQRRLIEEVGQGSSNGGRPPALLRFNSSFGFVVGVDIGGSQVRVALADLNGSIVGKWSKATPADRTPEGIARLITAGIRELRRQNRIPSRKLLALGAGAPGITDVRAGIVLSAPCLSRWQNVPLRQLLERNTRIPTAVENDVNLGALGESWCGSARGAKNFIFLAMGTGVGAGLFVNGHLYHGSDWAAGEIGYLHVPGTAEMPLAIARPGPLESVIGGHGIQRSWRKLCAGKGKHRRLSLRLKPTEVFDQALSGQPESRQLLEQTARILAAVIANVSVILNPSLVVFGGGIGTNPSLFEATRRILERNEFARPRLALSLLGPDAQLFGAIRLALDQARALGQE